MGALPFQGLAHLSCSASISPSCMENEQPKNAMAKKLHDKSSSLTVKRLPRRMLLQFMGFNPILLCAYPIIAAPLPEMKEPEVIRIQGLQASQWCENSRGTASSNDLILTTRHKDSVREIIEGEGSEAHEGDLVEVNYVCRRSNGYFVHSTVDQFSGESKPITLPLDENQVIKGLKEVLIGMRVGGKRRALIPPSLGYIDENLQPIPEEFGPRRSLLSHANEALVFEVQLLKVI